MIADAFVNSDPRISRILNNAPETIKNEFLIKNFPAKSIIQRKDFDLTSFFIICKGQVRVVNEFDCGNLYVIEKNEAIDFIGDVAALARHEKASVTTEAITDCLVIEMPLSSFYEWIKLDNNFLLMVSQRVATKLYNSSYAKGMELYYPTTHLVVNLIVNYIDNIQTINKSNICINLTRQQIAETIGVTTRTINRAIKTLKDDGLISTSRGQIHVDNTQYIRLIEALEDNKYC